MDLSLITKCDFERVYLKYAPTKFEQFYFKYFSINTLKKYQWVRYFVMCILFMPLLTAFICTISNGSPKIIEIATIVYSCLLICWAIPWIVVWFMHKCRLKKIQKTLGIDQYEYEFLVDKFYNEENLDRYIKNKVCQ